MPSILFTIAIGAIVLAVAISIMGFFGSNKFDVNGRTIVITGGSQGMGLSLATALSAKGANICIVARTLSTLDTALSQIKSTAADPTTQKFLRISADLTDPKENVRVIEEVTAWNGGRAPDVVWANAGMSKPGLFVETSIEGLRGQMDVNYWCSAYMAHATLRAWVMPSSSTSSSSSGSTTKAKTRAPRHFILTSSVAAFCGIAGYSPYSPCKAAARNLCDVLAMEVHLYNGARHSANSPTAANPEIKIHVVAPATIYSPGYEEEEKVKHAVTKKIEESDGGQSADEVAAAAIKGLERGDYLIATTLLGKLMRSGALNGSPRNGWGLFDTLASWACSIVWLFVGPDMDSTTYKWAKTNGWVLDTRKV